MTEPLGQGLINDTWLVQSSGGRYVLQRINARVFPNPEQVMENLQQVLALFAGDGGELVMPALVAARDGRAFVRDSAGHIWRLMGFIDNSLTLQTLQSAAQAQETGRALAEFHRRLAALDSNALHDTLPGFHVTPEYLDACDRTPAPREDSDELRYCRRIIEQGRHLAPLLQQAEAQGCLYRRITHGDPKLNNFLFDLQARRVISLIDLDTVKPGLLHHDIGDCIRSCCNVAGESGEEAEFELNFCRELLGAWLQGIGELLTKQERDLLFAGILLLPWELGLRFFTDHLQGDRYFKTDYPGQNLKRARSQFRLYEQILAAEKILRRWIAEG